MTVVLVQPEVVWEDRSANIAHVRELLKASPPPAGALVVLPELFAVGFSMAVERIHDGPERPTERFLAELADAYGVCVLGGVVRRSDDGRGRNEAVALAPGADEKGRYCKIHPFRYAGETDHYVSGTEVVTFTWQATRIAPFICYDVRFPEIYRLAAARGAVVLVTIANFPTARVDHWVALLRARAIENQAYVVGVNRVGEDPNVAYPGRSLVIDPEGRTVADAGAQETVLHATLDLDALHAYRRRFPALQDMRYLVDDGMATTA